MSPEAKHRMKAEDDLPLPMEGSSSSLSFSRHGEEEEEEENTTSAAERGAKARKYAEDAFRRALEGSSLLIISAEGATADFEVEEGGGRRGEDGAVPQPPPSSPRSVTYDIDNLLAPSFPRISPSNLTTGELLGRGGFSDVYEVTSLGRRKRESGGSGGAEATAASAAAAALSVDDSDAASEGNEELEEGAEDEAKMPSGGVSAAADGGVSSLREQFAKSGKKKSRSGSLKSIARNVVRAAKMCGRRRSSCCEGESDDDDYDDSQRFSDASGGGGGGGAASRRSSSSRTLRQVRRRSSADRTVGRQGQQRRWQPYAVKRLSISTAEDELSLRNGAADLVLEAAYLSALRHPNLVRLHGVSEGGCAAFETFVSFSGSSSSSPPMPGPAFFLVLDRLYGTLEDVIHVKWAARAERAPSPSAARRKLSVDMTRSGADVMARRARQAALFLAERLSAAHSVASALAYLHERGMLHRDIKSDNVGFDAKGNIKLFDLGLAKELKPSALAHESMGHHHDDEEEKLYNLTGRTGSIAYMSPEVARSLPYGRPADVYSFSILLWEACALSRPYLGMGPSEHSSLVVHGSVRPPMDTSSWSHELQYIMGSGWDTDVRVRPTMAEVRDGLKEEVLMLGGTLSEEKEDDSDGERLRELLSGVGSARRSSTMVLASSSQSSDKARRVTRSATAA